MDSLQAVSHCLAEHGVEVVVEDATAAMLGDSSDTVVDRQSLGVECDLIIVVGGDGSLLGVGRDLAHSGVPVLGVNRGGLGFLADISPDQIALRVAEVLAGEYVIEDHFLLLSLIHI